jgi:hypothetical protein
LLKRPKKNKVMNLNSQNNYGGSNRPGIVLLLTLVLLVVLSALGYTLTTRVAAQRHRDRYMIDYTIARYACDSAVKYVLDILGDIDTPSLVIRADEPDFSDIFALTEAQYQELLEEWAAKKALDELHDINRPSNIDDFNDVNDIGLYEYGLIEVNDPNSLVVRGPYGPVWPFITEPVEFEIGSAKVRIEIEDENAKYPFGWAAMDDKKVQREALAGFETFCEWMDVNETDIGSLEEQLKKVSKIKSFQLDFKPIKERKTIRRTTRSRRRGGRRGTRTTRRVVTTVIPATVHITDFARLFHSSLISTEVLARPTIVSESRKESALKYMGMWGSSKVNINTAPRQVLEAAFTFGGDYREIAEEIIQRRRIKPFENIEELRKSLLEYSDSIEKCRPYLTTVSSFFTIRVTALSGVAKTSTVIALTKDGKKTQTVAMISG